MLVNGTPYRTVWLDGTMVKMIDQRVLPHRFVILACPDDRATIEAIITMAVRGAGAIGAAAGYAMAQAVCAAPEAQFDRSIEDAAETIRRARPTAYDLFYAVERVLAAARAAGTVAQARARAVAQAEQLADDNAAAGEAMGRVGAGLLKPGARVLTHCNAGWLAFVDWGSALAPIYWMHRQGQPIFVYATETRPRSQGAKLTVWELKQAGIPHTLIADTAAGWLFQQGELHAVIVGADRIAANGDTANKIGTYTLAVLAQRHRVPLYVAAPRSTFDLATLDGHGIKIEERSGDEVRLVSGVTRAGEITSVCVPPDGTPVRNPAFDVTPASLITKFITEAGLVDPQPDALARFIRQADGAAATKRAAALPS